MEFYCWKQNFLMNHVILRLIHFQKVYVFDRIALARTIKKISHMNEFFLEKKKKKIMLFCWEKFSVNKICLTRLCGDTSVRWQLSRQVHLPQTFVQWELNFFMLAKRFSFRYQVKQDRGSIIDRELCLAIVCVCVCVCETPMHLCVCEIWFYTNVLCHARRPHVGSLFNFNRQFV